MPQAVGNRQNIGIVAYLSTQKYEKAVYPLIFSFYQPWEQWKLNGLALGDAAADDLKTLNVTEPAN
jgi:hypothetical protein